MIPYAFNYHRPSGLPHAQELFSQLTNASFLAGGQTLIPAMKQRLASPSHLIDLSGLEELAFVVLRDETLCVGAGVRHGDVAASPEVGREFPALGRLAGNIGDPAVRNAGTIGGSLANNDPAADYPAAVLGTGANIVTTRRQIAADEFFTGMFQTALEQGEIITAVEFPPPVRAAYVKFPNPASRYAIVGVFLAEMGSTVRVAVTGAGQCVFRVPAMEDALTRHFHPESVAQIFVDAETLNSDLHASAEYRAQLITVMAKRAVAEAIQRR